MIPEHSTYVEPFIGGGSIFLRHPMSKKEVINDLDKGIFAIRRGMKLYGDKVKDFKFRGSKKLFDEQLALNTRNPIKLLYKHLYLSKYSFSGNRSNYAAKRGSAKNLLKNAEDYKERLKRVTILNNDWKDVVKKYDSPQTFFYLDPPYTTGTDSVWGYKPMKAKDIAKVLRKIQGKFMLSFENTPQSRKTFNKYNIKTVKTMYTSQPTQLRNKTEIVVTNY